MAGLILLRSSYVENHVLVWFPKSRDWKYVRISELRASREHMIQKGFNNG